MDISLANDQPRRHAPKVYARYGIDLTTIDALRFEHDAAVVGDNIVAGSGMIDKTE